MTVLIILLGAGLALSLAFNLGLFGSKAGALPARTSSQQPELPAAVPGSAEQGGERRGRSSSAEAELDRRRKELEELRRAHAELKDDLKAAKRKLHELRGETKGDDDLAKARAEVERQASVQLENTRAELAAAQLELSRLRADAEAKGKKRAERLDAPVERAVAPEKPQEVITRVIRELSDIEKERIARLEAQSSSDRRKAIELDREVKSMRARLDRQQRESKHVFSEANLARDKFRAVEVRMNRTLLENDLLKRALADLEKRTGLHATHAQPTTEEFADSDRRMKEKHEAEDRADAAAMEKLLAPAPAEESAEADEPSTDSSGSSAELPPLPPATVLAAPALSV